MNVSRKSVSLALFNLLSNAYPFNRAERTGELPNDVAPTDQPALFLIRPAEYTSDPQAAGAFKYELQYGAIVYLQKDSVQGDLSHLDVLDDILDAIDTALQGQFFGMNQTLNGLVAECAIRGEIRIGTGILGQMCVLAIPITVITGI